ncbi:MAG: hypothetical protein QM760_01055 [Nibricoccus sp.]
MDRDTSGLLLMTDDGALLHRIISPKSALPKIYEATLADRCAATRPSCSPAARCCWTERTPLLPVAMDILGPRRVRLTLLEGRYHQVRRMFAAVGNHVDALHRSRIGGFGLDDLPSGQWRVLEAADVVRLFEGGE